MSNFGALPCTPKTRALARYIAACTNKRLAATVDDAVKALQAHYQLDDPPNPADLNSSPSKEKVTA